MPPNRTRPIIIRIAWSESEYAQVHAAAVATTGGNVSEYVRRKTLAGDGPGEVAELRERMARMEEDLAEFQDFFKHCEHPLPNPDIPETAKMAE
jgi:hypothetical protein